MQVAQRKNIRAIMRLLKLKGYKILDRPYELNIVGIRKDNSVPNKFDDTLYVFWKTDSGAWEGKYYTITTDPGTYWLKNPMSNLGAAILKEGQYENAYKLGLHRGEYKALVQQKPVVVFRDYDRNAVLDFNNGREEKGLFGINIHRSSSTGTSQNVDKWSAGCQVFENGQDFANFIQLAEKQNSLYGNNFTYTLVDERAYNRMLKRRGAYVFVALGLGVAGYFIYKWYNKK
jgi:hypothetical protein